MFSLVQIRRARNDPLSFRFDPIPNRAIASQNLLGPKQVLISNGPWPKTSSDKQIGGGAAGRNKSNAQIEGVKFDAVSIQSDPVPKRAIAYQGFQAQKRFNKRRPVLKKIFGGGAVENTSRG